MPGRVTGNYQRGRGRRCISRNAAHMKPVGVPRASRPISLTPEQLRSLVAQPRSQLRLIAAFARRPCASSDLDPGRAPAAPACRGDAAEPAAYPSRHGSSRCSFHTCSASGRRHDRCAPPSHPGTLGNSVLGKLAPDQVERRTAACATRCRSGCRPASGGWRWAARRFKLPLHDWFVAELDANRADRPEALQGPQFSGQAAARASER